MINTVGIKDFIQILKKVSENQTFKKVKTKVKNQATQAINKTIGNIIKNFSFFIKVLLIN